ncbi:MAG: glycosyl transferase family 1 [Pseudomonadota bacterium]
MTERVAYFAFDWGDAATQRRVDAFARDGVAVDGFAMQRGEAARPDWVIADLGQTRDNAYLQRVVSVGRGVRRALARKDRLAEADFILARNLDMLVVASITRRLAGIQTPLIYECLDIHRLMVREDVVGRILRRIEGRMLSDAAAIWVSSPAFIREYFEMRHPDRIKADLVENRIALAAGLGRRPTEARPALDRPLRLGWFGNLRCARSLALMEQLAAAYPGRLQINLRGYPALGEIPDFDARIAACGGIEYGGRYKAPDELSALYDDVDIVWAGDFMDAGFNSSWLLPNRLYEGGWFACPPIAPENVETGQWIKNHGAGFTIADPVEWTLPELIGGLIEDRAPIAAARAALQALPDETFAQTEGALRHLLMKVRA